MTKDQIQELRFQPLGRDGLKTLVKWAEGEGWNPGPYDAEAFWEADPNGFYGCFHGDELIGGGSIVSYDGNFGFMGFFIVRPEYRGNGIGRTLWYRRRDLLLSRLKPGAAIGMDGVLAMQSFYQQGGFHIAFRDERYERIGEQLDTDARVSLFQEGDLNEILEYDRVCFGFPRERFLKSWLNLPESRTFIWRDDNGLRGVATLRKATTGFKIGPLFAVNAGIAEALYRACLNAAPGEPVYLDIPVSNPAAVNLVRKYDARYVFECARMYYGNVPDLPVERIYGITTFELG